MPKSTPQSRTAARIARTEAYAAQVQSLFMQTVNRIIALNKKLPDLPEGEMFSFDAQTEKLRREVEMCLRQLHSVATTAITNGIALEWNTANAECNKLITSTFGKKAMETMQMTAWSQRNGAAMKAFIARSESGMNLSDRVWQSTRQLRDEMEIAITVAVGDGTSAASLSRNVRKYLNDPDLMFRRFRYKDPKTGEWRRKWKKRVIDPASGKVTFIDYDKDSYQDQWTGRGYYKSAAQNAMRVARTETNIAYRRADNERWQQMDFVVGQRIQLSRNHPHKDICDKLQGDYPKDFVFDGWHPQCFCFATPIMLDEDEILNIMSSDNWQEELAKAAARHEIKDYPANFKNWVHDNADNIAAARARGTEPYFIRNNAGIIDNILKPDVVPHYGNAMKLGRAAQKQANELYADAVPPTLTPEQTAQIQTLAKELGIEVTPMNFNEADDGQSNIIGDEDNCQSCVVSHEARLRGLDVTAVKYDANPESATYKIGERFQDAFISPKSGKVVEPTKIKNDNPEQVVVKLERNMQSEGRYVIGYNALDEGHVIIAEKFPNGKIVYYDPQRNRFINVYEYALDAIYFEVLRVDRLLFNTALFKELISRI